LCLVHEVANRHLPRDVSADVDLVSLIRHAASPSVSFNDTSQHPGVRGNLDI
jgi:hypothetical protein